MVPHCVLSYIYIIKSGIYDPSQCDANLCFHCSLLPVPLQINRVLFLLFPYPLSSPMALCFGTNSHVSLRLNTLSTCWNASHLSIVLLKFHLTSQSDFCESSSHFLWLVSSQLVFLALSTQQTIYSLLYKGCLATNPAIANVMRTVTWLIVSGQFLYTCWGRTMSYIVWCLA